MAAGPGIMRTYHDDGADLKAGMRGCFPHYDTSVWRRENDIRGGKRKGWLRQHQGLGLFAALNPRLECVVRWKCRQSLLVGLKVKRNWPAPAPKD